MVIPIHNDRGELVAYAGRSIDDSEPKYKLPTGFHKSLELFNLDRAVEAYNQAVGSLENRVLVSARKFAELGASVAEDIPALEPIETTARALSFEWDEEPTEIPSGDRKAG